MAPPTARERIIDAVVACVDRKGLRSFTVEDVAVQAGVARATVYRHFPDGRPQLVSETVTREVGRFWAELADHVRHLPDLEDRLVEGIVEARRRVDGHELLQRLLEAEPDALLPPLFASDAMVHLVLVGYLAEMLAAEPSLRPGLDPREAADYLSRMLVSHIATPGRWDLGDRAQVRRLVRTQFLAGVLEG